MSPKISKIQQLYDQAKQYDVTLPPPTTPWFDETYNDKLRGETDAVAILDDHWYPELPPLEPVKESPPCQPLTVGAHKIGADVIMDLLKPSLSDVGIIPRPPSKESIAWSEMDNQTIDDGIDEDGCATFYPYIIPDSSEADLMYERIQREKGGGSGRTKKKPSKPGKSLGCKLTPNRTKKRKAARKSRRINRKKK